MRKLVSEREQAMQLRRRGLSYREIRQILPVAKSLLSLWLKDFPLTKDEKRSLLNRVSKNVTKGRIRAASAHRNARLAREAILFKECEHMFTNFAEDSFFTAGVSLYWAEGAKRSSAFQFVNSDSEMMNVIVLWAEKFLKFSKNEMRFRLYIHKSYAHERCEEWWSKELGVPLGQFLKTIYKPTGLQYKKRPNYKGCLRLEIPGIRTLRTMQFFQKLLFAHFVKKR